jgi:molecular chaperone DnaK (HSP70)
MTAVAIDFGTSNTVVSILSPDRQTPETLKFEGLSRSFILHRSSGDRHEIPVIPSLVFCGENQQLTFGQAVRSRRLDAADPDRLFRSFKRSLVADFQPPPRQIDGIAYTPQAIAQRFFLAIWEELHRLGIDPTRAIFTVPVGAFDRYLEWVRGMGEVLGVGSVQVVDESTAAALGYALQTPGAVVLVVDFGGGTLDLSLVRTVEWGARDRDPSTVRAQAIAKFDAYLGGEDIDRWIVEDYLRQIGSNRSQVGEMGWLQLLEIAERLKIRLSQTEMVRESWFDEETFQAYKIELSRQQLEELLERKGLLDRLREAIDEVLAIATSKGISKREIERVLLVGGSCLIPAIAQLIISYFGRQKVKIDKPFEAVAHGALALERHVKIEDYLRHSYAIRLWEPYSKSYSYWPIFEQGTSYPTAGDRPLVLQVAVEGQREIRLDIGEVAEITAAEVIFDPEGQMSSTALQKQTQFRSLQGRDPDVCIAHLDPPGQVGFDRIAVQFEIDEMRVLLVTVRDILTGELLVERSAIAKLH